VSDGQEKSSVLSSLLVYQFPFPRNRSSREPVESISNLQDRFPCAGIGQLPSHFPCLLGTI
jgi:hypothetical protein